MNSSTENQTETARSSGKRARGRTARFIAIFVVCVLALLTGYRYAIPTRANDWYLFQVALHTAWVLDKIGHSGKIEERRYSEGEPARIRAEIAAWRQGLPEPGAEALAQASTEPLAPWERWRHRALKTRRRDPDSATGPRVSFIWKPGLSHRIEALEKELDQTRGNQQLNEATRGKRLQELTAQVSEMRRRLNEMTEAGADYAERRGASFIFIVVPECGAIEVMAIFFAAVLAFPTRWWKRLLGILLGVPIMYLVNIFRLSCLAVIGALDQGGEWFSFAHHFVWQAIYIVFVVAVWLAWVEYVVRLRRKQ